MNKQLQIVYIPTKVEDELPENNTNIFCLDDNGFETEVLFENGKFYVYYSNEERIEKDNVTHWLKPTEEYVFTPEELKQLLEEYTNRIVEKAEAKTKCYPFGDMESYPVVDKESITSQLPKFLKEKGYE